ncbi:MAG: EamA family transporter [Ancrocorticia sp.]|uniref:EamA family transporter n=1 Tax=Ancrocorticia sp. TaxID=2593684 RepID=UPI003F907D61
MWVMFALGSALFAGVTAVLAKLGIRDVDSNLATALRTIVVLVLAWAMVFVVGSRGTIGEIDGHTWLFLVLSGLATGASWLCYFRALQVGDVNKVVPVDKSSTVLTMILAFVFLGERVNALVLAAMVAIGIGTLLMIERRQAPAQAIASADPVATAAAETHPNTAPETLPDGTHPAGQSAGSWTWLLYAGGAAIFAALTAILGKIGIEDVDSTLGTAIRTAVVLVMAWLIVFIQGTQRQIATVDRRSWAFLILSGLTTGASWLCFYRALQEGPASVVVPIDKLSILVSIAFGAIVFGERLSARAAIGLALIVAGTLALVM